VLLWFVYGFFSWENQSGLIDLIGFAYYILCIYVNVSSCIILVIFSVGNIKKK